MNTELSLINNTDIYLVDQILKGRYGASDFVLDAGCGTGRNLPFFLKTGCEVWGIDQSEETIRALQEALKLTYPSANLNQFIVGNLEKLPFEDGFFDHVICNAVLHFADGHEHCKRMLGELSRCLATGGTLWLRMTTLHTIEHLAKALGDGRYELPDGSERYLLNKNLWVQWMDEFHLEWLEPIKTVNVNDLRTMATVIMIKQ